MCLLQVAKNFKHIRFYNKCFKKINSAAFFCLSLKSVLRFCIRNSESGCPKREKDSLATLSWPLEDVHQDSKVAFPWHETIIRFGLTHNALTQRHNALTPGQHSGLELAVFLSELDWHKTARAMLARKEEYYAFAFAWTTESSFVTTDKWEEGK